ncbi:MAG TPA: DUF92 domain-containing protein [Gemmatimonadales bacterium]|nr:DUF92 domain-containing protein [Gemmatimonadales bacterium]
MSLPLAAAVSAGVTAIAWYAGTLSRSGVVAAWTIGFCVLYGTGWSGGAVLAAFFVSTNLVSRLAPSRNSGTLDAKGDRRDGWQVYANGGPAALAALIPADIDHKVWLISVSLAAAAADTWATAAGAHSRGPTRLLTSGAVVPSGTSGGVTPAGSLGAVFGSMLVAGVGALVIGRSSLFAAGTLIGFLGMVLDSFAGSRWQGRFYCVQCNQPSERRVHRCGCRTERRAGWQWLSNDGVNLLATAAALLAGWGVWVWLD